MTAALACPASLALSDTLRIGGSGSGLALLKRLGDAYGTRHAVDIEVVPSLGSSGGIAALADSAIDIAVSARPLKPEEQTRGLREFGSVRTPFILATSRKAPDSIAFTEVAAIFAGEPSRWAGDDPVRVVLRPESESDTHLLMKYFPGMAEALNKARSRTEIPVAATDQDNATAGERMEDSLIATTLVQVLVEERALRPVPIDAVIPTIEHLESGRYPYSKTLIFLIRQDPGSVAEGFTRFLLSDDAASIMRVSGVLPPRQ